MFDYMQRNDQNQPENDEMNDEKASLERAKELEISFQDAKLPEGFYFQGGWLYYKRDFLNEELPIKICSRLEVVARTRNTEGLSHGRLLSFYDLDDVCHQWPMPMKLFATDGKEYRSELLDRGLLISREKGSHTLLSTYIQESQPKNTFRCVSRTGWMVEQFVLPDITIGKAGDEPVIFQSDHALPLKFGSAGNLDDFHRIAGRCIGNSLMIFAVSIAFAAPLLELVGAESGGFNLVGPSSIGKSKLLRLAASIWGPPENVQQWRATSNGLEGLAMAFNDCLLCLDELGQVDPEELGQAIYMLGNSVGKARAVRSGGLKVPARWRLLFLSSGEIGIFDHMSSAHQRARAGHEVRAIDLQAGDREFGCYEELHGVASGADFSQKITLETSNCFGFIGRRFLENITLNRDQASKFVKETMSKIISDVSSDGMDGQVIRVLERFALVAAAGELASSYGLTQWPAGTAVKACSVLFSKWQEDRGNLGKREDQLIIDQVTHFFELNGSARFMDVNMPETKIIQHAGYRKKTESGWEFRVFPNVFNKEICKGYTPKQVIAVLRDNKLLIVPEKGAPCPTFRVPDKKAPIRLYHISSKILPQLEKDEEV